MEENYKTILEQAVKDKKDVEALMKSSLFKRVILKKYCEEYVDMNLRIVANTNTEVTRNKCVEKVLGTTYLKDFLNDIIARGNSALEELNEPEISEEYFDSEEVSENE